MTAPDRMVVWLREAMDAAERIARSHRHPCGDWEYDPMCGEIRDLFNAGTVAFVGKDDPAGEHMAAHDPAAVLRRIDADRKTLDDLLDEKHNVVDDPAYTCPAATTEGDGGQNYQRGPCDCGRDERATRYLRLLAEGWGWTETRSAPECMCTPSGECGNCWEKRKRALNAHATEGGPQ